MRLFAQASLTEFFAFAVSNYRLAGSPLSGHAPHMHLAPQSPPD
jgi:hypothetical protein